MKISIAMATYNGSSYIKEQLNSFLNQTRLPDELVITDDCSSDDTVEIIKEFAKKASFPVVLSINKKNLGYAGNFNAALERATGDLVFLSDQDDFWFPEKLETITRLAAENPDALIIMNNAALTDGLLNEVGLTALGQLNSVGLTTRSFVLGCCCAIRRELLSICMPIPENFTAHDTWFVVFADALEAKKIHSQVLQYYRRHESNTSHFIANRTTKLSKFQMLLSQIKSIFGQDALQRGLCSIEQLRILSLGIDKAASSEHYRDALKIFLSKTEKEIKNRSERIYLRRKIFFIRIPMVLIYFAKGGYADKFNINFLVRDLIGYPFYWPSFKINK